MSGGVSELMCHPGYLDADLLKAGTRLLAQREVEVLALSAPPVKKLVADRGIQLISYAQLGTNAKDTGCGSTSDNWVRTNQARTASTREFVQ